MAPRKAGTKRRSDSPISERNVETKKCRTRASKRNQVSYKEDSDFSENEAIQGKKGISDKDFAVDEEMNDEVSSSKSRTRAKRAPKTNVPPHTNHSISAFKPVNVDDFKVTSELNLSDSDSDDSTSIAITSNKYSPSSPHSIHSSIKQEKKDDDLTSTGNHSLPGNLNANVPATDIWMSNLEALNHGKVLNCKNDDKLSKDAIKSPSIKTKNLKKVREKKQRKAPAKEKSKKTKQEDPEDIDVSELLKFEKLHADAADESEDDENWEKVKEETMLQEERQLPDKVEVMVDVGDGMKKRRKELDIQNMIRLKLNRIRREIQMDLHQVSLVGLLAHGYLVNKMLNDPEIAASALSVVPQTGFPPSRTDLNYLEKLVHWIHKHFRLKPKTKTSDSPSYPGKADVLRCISSSEANSKKELVYASIAICRSLGILARFVWSLQPISAKVDPSELQLKTSPCSNKTKKSQKDECEELSESNTVGKSKASKKKETSSKTSSKTVKKEETTKKSTSSKGKTEFSGSKTSKYFEDEKTTNQTQSENDNKSGHVKKGKRIVRSEEKPEVSKSASKSKGKNLKEPPKKDTKSSRSRRKSTEKPVNYQESSADDTEEDLAGPGKAPAKKRSAAKETTKKESKKKSRPKSRNSQRDSSDDFEEVVEDGSSEEESLSELKKKDSSFNRSSKIISTESDGDALRNIRDGQEKKRGCNVWMEVYLEHEEQWMSVDVIGSKVHCDRQLERNASSIVYVVAYNPDLTWKDVTARYASSFFSVTRKQRAHRGWSKLLSLNIEKPSARSKAEDENLERSLTERPMPTSVSEFKNHPLYALQRHLLKFEGIYPPTAMPIGYIRGEPVFARECVKLLHSRDTWLKEAKVVRIGEKPYKIVKARPKWDRYTQKMVTDLPLELFGEWQVEDYVPPPAVDGVVPRNPYGNVELFKPCMLPKGTVHLQIPGLNKIARRLGIDCAPAMTGWEARGGYSCPVYDGYVVCEENVEALLDAWQEANAEQEEREREKREKRVYGNWRRLIRGLLIKERLHAKYFSRLTEEVADPLEDVDIKPDTSSSKAKATSKKGGNNR